MITVGAATQVHDACKKLAMHSSALDLTVLSELTRVIVNNVFVHVQVPMPIARGSSSLLHKVASLMHALFLESGSLEAIRTILNQSWSLTTDMGTEFSTADFRVQTLEELLPTWMGVSADATASEPQIEADLRAGQDIRVHDDDELEADVGFLDRPGDAETDDIEPELVGGSAADSCADPSFGAAFKDFLFTGAFNVYGFLHLIGNAMKDSSSACAWWKRFEEMFRQVSRLLSRTSWREKFIQTCLIGTDHEWMATAIFGKNIHSFIDWRWGSLTDALRQLLRIGTALRRTWSKERFRKSSDDADAGQADRDGDVNEEGSLDTDLLDNAIRSSRFWSYAEMLNQLHSLPDACMQWAESCPCHAALFDSPDFGIRRKRLQALLLPAGTSETDVGGSDRYDFYQGVNCCPCGGCRLPEAVMSGHLVHLLLQAEKKLSHLLVDIAKWNPTAADIEVCLNDYNAGKDMLRHTIELKTAFLKQFPYSCAGLAHHDEEKAKAFLAVASYRIMLNVCLDSLDSLAECCVSVLIDRYNS